MITRIKMLIVAAVMGIMCPLVIQSISDSAVAVSGSMTYNGYAWVDQYTKQNVDPGNVEDHCNCTPNYQTINNRNGSTQTKYTFYLANNSTFAWDICQVELVYKRNWFSDGSHGPWYTYDFKARVGCNGALYIDSY